MRKQSGKGHTIAVNLITVCVAVLEVLPSAFCKVSTVSLSSPIGSFSTPTFPSHYPPSTEYVWLIKAQIGLYIKLTFDVVDVEAYRGECIDIVEVKDGDHAYSPLLLGGFCNANVPTHSFLSSSNSLRVWFQSASNSDGGAGFNASYITLEDQGCGGKLRSFPGTISSPRYPTPYPNDVTCQWDIVASPGTYIYVEFRGIYHMEVLCIFSVCKCMDVLEITDSNQMLPYPPEIGYCVAKPRPFTSKTNFVSLIFKTNKDGRYEGFNATYTTSLTPGCGADLYFDSGVITSPNFPNGYHSLSKCIWRITASPGHYVTLRFHKFDVNKFESGCSEDRVEIRDGYTQDSHVIGTFCNANPVYMVNSTGNRLFILFQSGYNKLLDAKGFRISYASHPHTLRRREPRHNEELEKDLHKSQKRPSSFAFVRASPIYWWYLSFTVFVVIK